MPIKLRELCLVAVWVSAATPAVCQPPEGEPTGGPPTAGSTEPTVVEQPSRAGEPPPADDSDRLIDNFFGGGESKGGTPAAVSPNTSTDQEPAATADPLPGGDTDPDLSLDQFFGENAAESGDGIATDGGRGQLKISSDLTAPTDLAVDPSFDSDQDPPPSELVDGYEPARQLALLHQRPLLVIFGAEWCVWCRKLEQDLESQTADSVRRQWIVAKVDVDDQPQLAQQMDVGSLPAIRILDTSGNVVASRTGYVEPAEFQSWLDENLEQADPSAQRVLFASGAPSPTEIDELVAMLQRRSPSIRASASRRLREHRSVTAGPVVDQLRNGTLGSQLTALEILEAWNAPVDDLDPWIPETISEERIQPLLQWVRSVAAERGSDELTASSQTLDERSAARIVRELIEAPAVRQRELAEQAVAGGLPVAEQVEQLLSALDSLSDDQRQRLRMVRYRILAGPATRIESAGLLESIARLDGPTRRAAAKKLVPALTSQDQPLIDELSRDSDPLVRELAVTAQSRVGALTEGDRLQRLLADDSPSVRTAVLRELAEDPTDEVTARLVDYLDTESDEDLLVYATRTLGQLAENEIASEALAKRLNDSRWRVRAAALDAIQQFLEDSSSTSWFSATPPTAPPPIADGVVAALEDEDPFVASKAITILPYVLSRDTAEGIADYILKDETRLTAVNESVEEYRREAQLKPLTDLAAGWLGGDDPQRIADATRLLTQIAPTKLRYKLADLLESPRPDVRVAALKASLPSLAEFREEQLDRERQLWQRFAAPEANRKLDAIPLLRPVPEVFLPITSEPEVRQVDDGAGDLASQSDNRTEAQPGAEPPEVAAEPTSLDLVDDFFGPTTTPIDDEPAAEDGVAAAEAVVDVEVALSEPEADDPQADETASSEGGGLLAWAGSLFGGGSTAQRDTEAGPDTGASWASVAEQNLDRDRLGLGSYWMHRWQNQRDSIERPSWMARCEPLVQEMTASADPVEQLWAQAVWLAYGNTDQLPAMRRQMDASVLPDDAPKMIDLVSWLPAAQRLEWLKQVDVDWKELSPESTQRLRAATQLDLEGGPGWLYEQISEHEVDRLESLAAISQLMLEAMLGRDVAQELPVRMADQLTIDPTQSLSVPEPPVKYAGQLAAIRWLLEQYEQVSSESQQTVLLSALSTVSRKHAIAEALGILDESEEETRLTSVATALALSDLRALSARRAAALLEHPATSVAEQAVIRLVSVAYIPDSAEMRLPVAAIYHEAPRLFALQTLDRPLPVHALRRFESGEPTTLSALADVLRMAAGEEQDPLEILERLRGREQARSLVAVALGRAGRTDEAAMQVYVACVKNADSEEAGAVYRALRSVKNDRIRMLRRQLLKTSNGFFP